MTDRSGPVAMMGVGGFGPPGVAFSVVENTETASAPAAPAVEIRSFFPETWLWNIVELGLV